MRVPALVCTAAAPYTGSPAALLAYHADGRTS
jgi:hypothetical protein